MALTILSASRPPQYSLPTPVLQIQGHLPTRFASRDIQDPGRPPSTNSCGREAFVWPRLGKPRAAVLSLPSLPWGSGSTTWHLLFTWSLPGHPSAFSTLKGTAPPKDSVSFFKTPASYNIPKTRLPACPINTRGLTVSSPLSHRYNISFHFGFETVSFYSPG